MSNELKGPANGVPTGPSGYSTDRPGENIRVIVVAAIDSMALFEELYATEVK